MRLQNRPPRARGKAVSGNVSNARVKEIVSIAKAQTCYVCGVALDRVPCHANERRTKIDIVFEKVVEHIDAEVKQCPN